MFLYHMKGQFLIKCDFSYSCAAADEISTDLRARAVSLRQLSYLYTYSVHGMWYVPHSKFEIIIKHWGNMIQMLNGVVDRREKTLFWNSTTQNYNKINLLTINKFNSKKKLKTAKRDREKKSIFLDEMLLSGIFKRWNGMQGFYTDVFTVRKACGMSKVSKFCLETQYKTCVCWPLNTLCSHIHTGISLARQSRSR